jgi:diaminopimelate decarboxylase
MLARWWPVSLTPSAIRTGGALPCSTRAWASSCGLRYTAPIKSSDVFARDRVLPPLEVDDLVAILDTGAYGSVMASNYNRHLLPAEVLVDDGQWTLIRRRQTIDDVLALEL